MKELSLNILDIAQNSISANASLVEISVVKDTKQNLLALTIKDDGKGMAPEFLKNVTDPFTTTRTTRKVGMGIPLLKLASEQAEGQFAIQSEIGVGTVVTATFKLGHIDRVPLGDVAQTISSLVSCNEQIDFLYRHTADGESFLFDTKQIREVLDGVPFNTPEVVLWMQEYINDGILSINGGVD
ncbi:MAG: sensor histidine kinase [Clostridia bacterium]|nr:sensor histidine kinase [Clostridia bacterium]